MTVIDIILLAVALAMDCFAISIVCGVIFKKRVWPHIFRIAFLFGLFQALMPLLGWLGTSLFQKYIESFDHWIAFGLLAYLGGRMIADSFKKSEMPSFNPRKLTTQVTLATATSIDALAIGISFACTNYTHLHQLTLPLVVIGLASFILSIVGFMLGLRQGNTISEKIKPELLGGIVLIGIGIKILLTHLWTI